MSQRDPEVDRDGAIGELSGDVVAAHHDGAIRVKVEAGVRLASAGGGAPAAAGEGGVALPVSSDADDGDASPAMGDSRLLEEGAEAADGLPSFSPDVAAPGNPAGPDDERGAEGAAPPSHGGETPSIDGGLSLLSLADGTRGIGSREEGTRTPDGGGGGLAAYAGTAGTDAPPPGVVSSPAVTVFGGGFGAAIEAGGDGSANIAHSVEVSGSESDLESSPPAPAPAAPAPTAPAAPVDDGVRLGAGGALQ